MRFHFLILCIWSLSSLAQFDPAGGELGSKSILADHPSIYAWADSVIFEPGWLQINDKGEGKVASLAVNALAEADGMVVSMGDSGYMTFFFSDAVIDQEGYDFAIFENGFAAGNAYYLELAFVEVSADGLTFTRFPAETAADSSQQLNFGATSQPEYYHNLAGKHQSPYGTLFDLSETGLDSIHYIRVVDVIGSVIDSIGSRDSKGRIINDPFPTPFASGGFDIDALALVDGSLVGIEEQVEAMFNISPNPRALNTPITLPNMIEEYRVYTANGQLLKFSNNAVLNFEVAGVYMVQFLLQGSWYNQRVIVY